MKFKKYVILAVTVIIMIVSGCVRKDTIEVNPSSSDTTSKYLASAREFNKIYFDTIECVDLSDTMKSLEALQSKERRESVNKLGALFEEIKKTIPKDREMLRDNFGKRYEGLVFLNESYPKYNSLSEEERGNIDGIFIDIGFNRTKWEDKNSDMVWE
jgi:hypothetical protein